MRTPKIENYSIPREDKYVKRHVNPEPFSMNYILDNEKAIKQFVDSVEVIVRKSSEYKDYVAYLKEFIDMTRCSFFTNIENVKSRKLKIEIHHEPFSLYELVLIVLRRHLKEESSINKFAIAEEVMELHYQNFVGLIPLSLTVHKLVHNSKLFIPIQAVYGNIPEFIRRYNDYIPSDIMEILEKCVKVSRDIQVNNKQDLTILGVQYVYLEIDGMCFPTKVSEIPNLKR